MEKGKGCFYALSVGPGDPELMTIKAVKLIKETQVLAVPVNAKGSRTAYDIAAQILDLSQKEMISLKTAMVKDKEKLEETHRQQVEQIKPYLDEGRDVAMLTLGDVSIYSTAMYLLELLEKEGYETKMVAGVPSFCAIAAKMGISLTRMDQPLHIIPASYGDTTEDLSLYGSKVLMKSGRRLEEVLEEIKKHGLVENTFLAADCGMESEILCRDIRELKEMTGYFTTIIVREDER
jgi:precorrin-2/cobalt-factor-2 C20-methyltransferase